jgi:hypothetical protein
MLTERMQIQALADRLAGVQASKNEYDLSLKAEAFTEPWRACWQANFALPLRSLAAQPMRLKPLRGGDCFQIFRVSKTRNILVDSSYWGGRSKRIKKQPFLISGGLFLFRVKSLCTYTSFRKKILGGPSTPAFSMAAFSSGDWEYFCAFSNESHLKSTVNLLGLLAS